MNNLLYCLSVGIIGYLLFPSTTLAEQPITSAIGNIQNTKDIQGGGCHLSRKGQQKYVFRSEDSRSALMNIDGKDLVLKLVSETRPQRIEKKGDRSTAVYKAGKINVRIDRVTTRVCLRGDEECESASYDGKIKLNIGDRSQTIAVEGMCGS